MIGWDPKTEVEDSFPSAEVNNKKVSCLAGFESKPVFRVEDKRISETRGTLVLQASVKNSLKSISP